MTTREISAYAIERLKILIESSMTSDHDKVQAIYALLKFTETDEE